MLLTIMIILLFIFILLGMDIAYSIGLAALAFIALSQFESRPINPVLFVQELTAGVDSFSLLAIPMFIFAGELMTKSSVVRRLITLALSLVGHKSGGLGNVCITSNLFLAGISGSAVADAAAVGSTMIPEMKKRGYTARYAAGVISASACMAPIIPPSIMFILLGSIANISVGALFLAGILPGLVMFVALLAMNSYLAKRDNLPREPKMDNSERWRAIRAGLLPLGAPGLVIATKVLGIATPTESAALVVLYTLFLGCIVYRDMSWSGFMSAAISAAMISAAIMMTVATSQIFGSLAILAGLGQTLTDAMLAISSNPWVLLMLINIALLILGTVMEPLPLMLILSPILFPLLGPMGIDPIHLGLILVFNLVLGGVTPPVGLNLFVMARVARIPMMQVFWGGLPFYSILFAVLILLTYVPQITLFLPNLLMK
jgi:tripartite ATP-independent transporter DctM subunit